jgi:hypothetical protein
MFNPVNHDRVKEEVGQLLDAGFICPCRYTEWNVPIEKNTSKIQLCVDFRNLNKATRKVQYSMPIADTLINNASRHQIISFLDGNTGYNQSFVVEEDMSKMVFRCPGLSVYLNESL